jgi:hypothetical protein
MRPPSTGRSWRSWPAALVVVRGTLRAPMGGFCLPDLGLLALLATAQPAGAGRSGGDRWNLVAPTTVYEDIAAIGYEPAFTVSARETIS